MKWQIIINGTNAVLYGALSMGLMKLFGLTGFCFGALITNVVKLIIMIIIYFRCKIRDDLAE